MKHFTSFLCLILLSTTVFSQKINVEQYRPPVKDSILFETGMQYIKEGDSIRFEETLSDVYNQLGKKKSATSSLMTATLWADEMVDQGQAEQAFNLLKETGEIFRSRYDTMNMAWAFYHKSLAYYHYRKANYKKRVAHHQAEINIVRDLDNEHPLLIEIFSQLMTAHWSARDVKEGFECYDEVLKLVSTGDYDYYRVNTYLNAVNILKFYNPSVASYFATYTHYLANGEQASYFFNDPYFFISLGSSYTATDKHREALDMYSRGLEVFQSSENRNPLFLASLYYYIGVSHKNLVYYDPDTTRIEFHHQQADIWLDSALVTVKERIGKSHPMYSRVINLKGQNLNNWGKYEEALPVNEEAWRLVEKQHGRHNKYYSQQAINELARSQLRSGNHADALETYHRQICYFLEVDDTLDFYNPIRIDTARFSDSYLELSRALVGKATSLEKLMAADDLDTAMVSLILDHYAGALSVLDARASMALTAGGLQSVSVNFKDVANRIVNFLCRNDFPDDAVEQIYKMVAESKANALLAGIYRGDNPAGGDSDDAVKRINELQDALQRVDAETSGPEYERLMEELLALQKERFVSNFGQSRDVEKIRLPKLANINKRSVNSGIDANEMVLDYFTTPEYFCQFIITNEGISYKSRPYSREIEDHINSLYRGIKTGDNTLVATSSETLYNKLMIDLPARNAKLTVIPDGSLYLVPFEVLYDGHSSLIESTAITYRYASHLFANNKRDMNPGQQDIAMFAPVFDNPELAYAPVATHREEIAGDTTSFRSGRPDVLKDIPYSEMEVAEIQRLFSNQDITRRLFFRENSSESAFKSEAGKSTILHVATHGYADMENPGNSGLFFSPDDEEDGFLFMNEIFDLELNADLVVLSACKTGAGEIHKGEGVMALPRGFIHAGVPNVLASMWKVHDERTKELMVTFYEYLLSGNTYHEALRKAKLQCIEDGFLPVDWAGFLMVEG